MFNLLELYRSTIIKELIIVYTKTLLVKEFISIFPLISKLDFDLGYFDSVCKQLINEKYILYILNILNNKITINEVHECVNTGIDELKKSLNTLQLKSFSMKNDFPFIFPQYDIEQLQDNKGFYGQLDINKYNVNNIYIEKYIRIEEDENINIAGISNRSTALKQIVNIKQLYDFINDRTITNDKLFKVFKKLFFGIRLIYIPEIKEDRVTLFDNLISDKSVMLNKTNAISGNTSNVHQIEYFFPIQLSILEEELIDSSFFYKESLLLNLKENSTIQKTIFNNLIKNFWNSDNFFKLFTYHIPVPVFEILIPNDQLYVNELVKDVYNKNLSYNNLEQILITLIEHIVNAEDPSKL